MTEYGYSRSKYDSCVYHQKLNDDSFVYLLFYVDDMLIAVKKMCEIGKLKAQLKQKLELKDLGAAKKTLGKKIHRNKREEKLFLLQKENIKKVLERFDT